jgi:hypothetical protein
MSGAQYMLLISRVAIVVSYCLYVIFISGFKCFTCCPIYFNRQSIHLLLYMLLFSHLSRRQGFAMFYISFFVWNAMDISVISFVSFSIVCKYGPFCCLMLWDCIFIMFLISCMTYAQVFLICIVK